MLAVELFNPDTLFGVIGPILAILAILVMAYAYSKANTGRVWKETAEGYKERVDQLRDELKIATDRISALETLVAELKIKTDVTSVREAVAAGNEKLSKQNAEIAERLSKENAAIADRLVESNKLIAAQLSVVTAERSERLADQIAPKSTSRQVEDLGNKLNR